MSKNNEKRNTRSFVAKVAGLVLGFAAGCSQPTAPPSEAVLEPRIDRVTTDGVLAADNLDAEIAGLERLLGGRPPGDPLGDRLLGLYLSRTQFFGRYSDFDRAEKLASVEGNGESDLRRARWLSAVHRFAEADALLAAHSASPNAELAAVREAVALATDRDLLALKESRQAAAERHPSYATLSGLAAIQATLGEFDAADASYRQAARHYHDVSPFPLAWLFFQRGVLWAEMANRPERSRQLYQEAVRLLPGYVVANVHLAELEWQEGDTAAAIARLRALAGRTEDPEPAGLLGEILLSLGDAEGQVFLERARARYDALLSTHPAAFADHASEFFAGPGGDPGRGLTLALANLATRPTPRAYLVALEATVAAKDGTPAETLCDLARLATPLRARHANLSALLDLVFASGQRCE